MKKALLLILIFSSGFVFSQGGRPALGSATPIPVGLDGSLFAFYGPGGKTRIDYARIIVPKGERPDIKGSPYAFKTWNNRALLKVDARDYKLNNVNFNMYTNTIEAKVGKDSVYIFDLANVDHAYINNKKFKSFYVPNIRQNKIFEQLYESKEFDILKGYEVGIRKPEIDPTMVRKQVAKYFTTRSYYVKRGNNIKPLSLKKKEILALFGSKSKDVVSFVKENKLSYKKDQDLKNIFAYYKQL